jgi:serine/threonine-protein kinase
MLMTKSNSSPAFGEHIGRYRIVAELARGGMGIVYVAVTHGPAGFSKLVALKELRPELVEDPEALTMFIDEARLAARLTHPNIVLTQDVSESDGRHFIAMEYLEGRSLNQVLRRFGPKGGVPQRLALSVLRDVLAALDYAHALTDTDGRPLGFVHRDVSPHNVLITFDGHTKVIDFGIAKARDSSLETRTGVFKGRANYMAPEQLTKQADRRSDLFAVGVILYEIATGKRLWQGMSDLEILGCLTRAEIPGISRIDGMVPPTLQDLLRTALSPKPEHRFETAAQMRDALDEYLWSTGGPPKPKEIGAMLAREFADERAKIRGVIDGSLARLAEGEGGELETLAALEPRDGTRRSMSKGMNQTGSQQSQYRVSYDVLPPVPQGPKTRLLRTLSENRLMIAAGILGFSFVITIVTVALRRDLPKPEPALAVVEAPPPSREPMRNLAPPAAAIPTVPSVPETIRLSVTVSPSLAQVMIDGEPMPSNPFLGSFPRSTAMHRVRAVAAGYEAKERLVSFAEDVILDLNLTPKPVSHEPVVSRREPPQPRHERAPVGTHDKLPLPPASRVAAPPPPVSVVAPPPPVRSTAPTDIQPRPDGPRRRAIDVSNPYGEEK